MPDWNMDIDNDEDGHSEFILSREALSHVQSLGVDDSGRISVFFLLAQSQWAGRNIPDVSRTRAQQEWDTNPLCRAYLSHAQETLDFGPLIDCKRATCLILSELT